ncbi:hypothetical protein P3X46_011283 [Hevea brasiliensis]|uniref:Uncharacterized protein n=1 Tax=Hevea brasiliensis TaxID=3981 RepID=A0ABQ9MH55_HEVBR|nr:hypothetical protein P3X46_011283 [Hevea brasiliensis]
MTPVCPFMKAAGPDDSTLNKPGEIPSKHGTEHGRKGKKESGESSSISPKCPFGYDSASAKSGSISPKGPLGYDSQTFKIGPLSCVLCQALLFESSRCVPCSHVYCK